MVLQACRDLIQKDYILRVLPRLLVLAVLLGISWLVVQEFGPLPMTCHIQALMVLAFSFP